MIVVDADLLVYLLLPGELTDAAETVLRRDAEWAVPRLWRGELRDVLTLYLRRRALSVEEAATVFEQAEELVGRREFEVGARGVLELAAGSRCTASECEYVALARELGVPLVTPNAKLLREFREVAVSPASFAA